MSLWQIILIILASVAIGLLAGYLLSYLIVTRVLKKPFNRRAVESPALVFESAPPGAAGKKPANNFAGNNKGVPASPSPATARIEPLVTPPRVDQSRPAVEKPALSDRPAPAAARPLSLAAGLLTEIETNYKIASQPWSGKLAAFETQTWDNNPDGTQVLPDNLREGLIQAYADMRLANSIVWLSTELGRRSANLDESYIKLCTAVAERLGWVLSILKRAGS